MIYLRGGKVKIDCLLEIELKKYISKKLKSSRTQLKLSQEQMSEKLMISARSYSDLERGKYFCSALVLINFVNNCDIDKDELFSDLKVILKDI